MEIRIYKNAENTFSIHPSEEQVSRIANLLLKFEFCRVTNVLTKATGHTSGTGFNLDSQPTVWSGLIDGFVIDPSASVKDIADRISEDYALPLKTIKEDEEYLITDRPDEFY